MDPAIGGALIGVGGVVFGVFLTTAIEASSRRKIATEQAEQARHARELVAAEQMDEGLIRAQEAIEVSTATLAESCAEAQRIWGKAWIAYSPRLRQPELLDRCQSVGSVLSEVASNDPPGGRLPRHVLARAIGNARATLGRFMRGDPLPANAFPKPEELTRLLGEGEAAGDYLGPLRAWLVARPGPDFHGDGESANKVQTCPTPFHDTANLGESPIPSNRAKSTDSATPQNTPEMGS